MSKNLALFTIGATGLTVALTQVSAQSVKAETVSSSSTAPAIEVLTKDNASSQPVTFQPVTSQTATVNKVTSKDGKAVAQNNSFQINTVESAVAAGVKKSAFVRSPMVSRLFPSMMQ